MRHQNRLACSATATSMKHAIFPLALALAAALPAQTQSPVTLKLDHVTMAAELKDTLNGTVDPPTQTVAGNSFTASARYTYKGQAGTATFGLTLPSANFTDSNNTGLGLALIPKAVFQYNYKIDDSRLGLASGSGVLQSEAATFVQLNRCVFTYNVPFPDNDHPPAGPCTLDPIVWDRTTRIATVHFEFWNATFLVKGDAYYAVQDGDFCPASDTLSRGNERSAGSCTDFIDLSNVRPDPADDLPETSFDFSGKVDYLAGSTSNAIIALRLFDKDGILQGSSDFTKASRSGTAVPLTIQGFTIANDTPSDLYLKAVLIDQNFQTVRAESKVYHYVIPDVSIPSVEFVQVIQTAPGPAQVPLVALKPTVMRIFVKQTNKVDNPLYGITATVGLDGASPVSLMPAIPDADQITAHENPDRLNVSHSLNYLLPVQWTTDGAHTYTIELQLQPGRAETPKKNNKVTVAANFENLPNAVFPLKIEVRNVCIPDCPAVEATDWLAYLERILPIAPYGVEVSQGPDVKWPSDNATELARVRAKYGRFDPQDIKSTDGGKSAAVIDDVLNHLNVSAGAGGPDVTVGFLPTLPGNLYGRAYEIPAKSSQAHGRGLWIHVGSDYTTLAHELGHLFGLSHTYTGDSCGQGTPARDAVAIWKHPTAELGDPGFDTTDRKFIASTVKELMSYCRPRWLSADYYRILADRFKREIVGDTLSAATTANKSPRADAADTPYVAISGYVSSDGVSGGLLNVYSQDTARKASVSEPDGDYCLTFQASGGVLTQDCFSVNLFGEDGEPLDAGFFSRKLAFPAGATRLALLHNGRELASLSGSSPPTVQFASPQQGATLQGVQTISWSATDPNGADLTSLLQYSSDGGNTWKLLMPSSFANSFAVDPAALLGGANVYFRVLASNGLLSASAVVGPVQIPTTGSLDPPPASLDLGSVQRGDTAEKIIALKNSGTGMLALSSVGLDNPGEFQVGAPVKTVRPGQSVPLRVRFSPSGLGTKAALLTVTTDAGDSYSVTLTANGVVPPPVSVRPAFDVQPRGLDFGSVTVGQSKTLTLTATNSGGRAINVKNIFLNDAHYKVVTPASTPFPIDPNSSRVVTLQFTPTDTSAPSIQPTATFTSDDPARPTALVTLTGKGAGAALPAISPSPAALDFGTVIVGQTSPPKTITITNTGSVSAAVSLLTSAPFAVSPASLNLNANGGKGTASVTFAPTSVGSAASAVNIVISGQSSVVASVKLSGSATSPPVANFGGQWNTDYGLMTLEQTGSAVTGTYPNGGRVTATVVGNVLTGNWSDSSGTGTLAFTLSADGNSFTGIWRRLTGTGNSGGTWNGVRVTSPAPGTDVILKVDGGVFDSAVGYPEGTPAVYFVNRLTPSSYPATLKSVQVFFGARSDGLPLNYPVTILSTTNPGGSPALSLSAVDRTNGTVSALGTFVTYNVAARTITSGDFVVGFLTANPPKVYPADQDQLTDSKQRSYYSTDGVNYTLLDTGGAALAGNLAIRAVVTLGTSTGTTCFARPANAVSWWPAEGNANDVAGGLNGTVQGGVSYSPGKVGQAFNFDGTGSVQIGNPAGLRLASAITIEGWINPRSAPASAAMAAVLTKWAQKFDAAADADSYGLWLRNNNGALTMFTAIHQSGTSEPNLQGGSIPLNAWSHVAMTFDATTGQYVLYVNGQPVASMSTPGPITPTSRNVLIGREDSSLPRLFNGLIDEAAVYSRALSGAEIQAIFNAGSAGKCRSAQP